MSDHVNLEEFYVQCYLIILFGGVLFRIDLDYSWVHDNSLAEVRKLCKNMLQELTSKLRD